MKTVLVLSCIMLSACAGTQFRQSAEKVDDTAMLGAVDFVCNIAPVAAVRRNFDTPEKREAWIKLCAQLPSAEFVLIPSHKPQ